MGGVIKYFKLCGTRMVFVRAKNQDKSSNIKDGHIYKRIVVATQGETEQNERERKEKKDRFILRNWPNDCGDMVSTKSNGLYQ